MIDFIIALVMRLVGSIIVAFFVGMVASSFLNNEHASEKQDTIIKNTIIVSTVVFFIVGSIF